MSLEIKTRHVGDVMVADLKGTVTLGEDTGKVRDGVREIVTGGHKKVLLNFSELGYMDSAGLGEIVGAYTTVTNAGGVMKLVGVSGKALDLLQVTRLATLFEVHDNEENAVKSFQ